MADLDLPTGTVTFLFTDLEGSTALLQAHPAAYREAVRRHHALLQQAVEAHGGVVFETVGDAMYAAFARPTAAVAAALAGQRALHQESWGEVGALRVRMGVHLGEVERQGGHYFGAPLYRCARLMAAAHGGQTVLSGATAALVLDALPAGADLRDLGEHRLRDLAVSEHIFQLVHRELPAEFPPLRTLDARPNNLPLQVTSFVGRERELAEVTRRLVGEPPGPRLVTLTGPGGTGKTRLALQAAADVLDAHPDGVWLVELAALADPAIVPQTVAAAVGVREAPGRPVLATLTDALKPRRLLLVLDNCEHLLDACARLADALLRACPHLRLLCTSREALGIAGEAAWRVPSLPVPADGGAAPPAPGAAGLAGYAAVRLFAERAAAVRPGFALTADNAAAVAQVCARLDGIPLAIELAAARVRVLPPPQLLARLDDRFRLLTGGSRTALERHQTLQATVDWSYALLTEPERTLFARLAAFAGGWTLEAAETVGADPDDADGDGIAAGAVLDLLTRLADKSLVVADEQPDGTARYRLLETLRHYARQKLAARGAAVDALRRRHAAHYLALAEEAAPHLTGPQQLAWLERLAAEQDNLRAALRWSLDDGAAAAGLRLAVALDQFWFLRRHVAEGRAWLAELLAAPGAAARDAPRARALVAAGRLAMLAGDAPQGRALLGEGLTLARAAGEAAVAALALASLGWVSRARGDYAAARPLFEEALAIFRRLGDRWGVAEMLSSLGRLTHWQGDSAAAHALCEEALATGRRLGDRREIAQALEGLGEVASTTGDPAAARGLLDESLAGFRELGDQTGVASVQILLGRLALCGGGTVAGRDWFAAGLRAAQEADYLWRLVEALEGLAATAVAEGRLARALRLAGAAAALREPGELRPAPAEREQLERWLAPARAALHADEAAAAWTEGRAMPLERAVAYALEEDRGG
jgi:predicted ATPase/class 3 adenylate cyclase